MKNQRNSLMGDSIRSLRLARGMTQRELADACGVGESALRSYELGARYPKGKHIDAIAGALEVRAEALDGYNIETSLNLVHAMFNCEERFGLIPDPNGFACLTSTDPIVRCALHDWGLMRAAMLNEEISVEEYRAWKDRYAPLSSQDQPPYRAMPSYSCRSPSILLRYSPQRARTITA